MEFKRKKCSRKMQKKNAKKGGANESQMGIVPPEMLSFSYAVGIPDEGWFGLQVSVMDLTL